VFELGEGVGKDLHKVIEYYKRSSEQGKALGQAWLG
jgi:TPR repeat protein